MNNNTQIFPIFSNPIYYVNDSQYRCTDDEVDFLSKLNLLSTNDNSLSENKFILEEYPLKNIKNLCQSHLDQYTKDVLKIKQNFKITNSWLTLKKRGQLHHFHSHPNSIFSGVFYVNVNNGELVFQGKPGFLKHHSFDYSYEDWNIFNGSEWSILVNTGSIVIFPSNLTHGAPINEHSEERIVIGFNSFVCGELSNEGYCTDLTINC